MAIFFFLTSPQLLIRAFLDPQDPLTADILRIGTLLLMLAALFQFVDAAQVVALSLPVSYTHLTLPTILLV